MLCVKSNKLIHRKLVVCGDGACGKTSLLSVFTQGYFPQVYEPTVFDNHVQDMTVDGHEIELSLWDVAGQEESDRVRILSYDNTHVVMLCFCVDDRDSLENVVHQWLDEVTNHCPDAKLILVALKCDLRDDPVVRRHRGNPVMYEEGLAIARSINAACYLECSAMHNRGVHECFEQACRVAMTVKLRASPDHSRFKECIIL